MLIKEIRALMFVFALGVGFEGSPSAAATTTTKLNWHPCAGPKTKSCSVPSRIEGQIFTTASVVQKAQNAMRIEEAARQARYTGSLRVDMGFATRSTDCCRMETAGRGLGPDQTHTIPVALTFLGVVSFLVAYSLRKQKLRKRKRRRRYALASEINLGRAAGVARRQVGWLVPLRRYRPAEIYVAHA